jgi:hypothetical protein
MAKKKRSAIDKKALFEALGYRPHRVWISP